MGFATVGEVAALLTRLIVAARAMHFRSKIDWHGMLAAYLNAYGGRDPQAGATPAEIDAAISDCRAMLPKVRDDALYADLSALLADTETGSGG